METKKTIYRILTGLLLFLAFSSCRNEKRQKNVTLDIDSTSLKLKYSDVVFTIPSPSQTLILLKNTKGDFQNGLLNSNLKSEKYTTTFRKSLVLGIWGADICYLNLFNQKEIALSYLSNIRNMVEELEITKPFESDFFKKLEENFGNNDSVVHYISELNHKCDEYLKHNDRNDIAVLIITGGWIESFYLLTKLYSKTNDKKIFTLILYQKEVINNLIKIISPLYKESSEYTGLVDDIVQFAYEFDVIDTNENINDIFTDSSKNITTIKNETKYILSGSQLEGISSLAQKLRDKYLL